MSVNNLPLYYLLNINVSKDISTSQVDEWIKNRKIAPIFYGLSTIKQIRDGTAQNNAKKPLPPDAKLFVDTFYGKINTNSIVVSLGEEYIYFYKQAGLLREVETKTIKNGKHNEKHLVKGFDIKLISEKKISECPLVLVTIKANRYMSAGTFKQIDEKKGGSYFGNCRAIEYLLLKNKIKVSSFEKYLCCLSALEFETFIAKLYEEQDYFVPSYKGGFIKNYDLFCKKDDKVTPIQIKLHLKKEHYDKNKKDLIYYCISSDIEKPNIKTSVDIEKELVTCPKTKDWLNETLNWVDL